MHAVGIRRVFWTNDSGEWEGGTVSSFMYSMDGIGEEGLAGEPLGNRVFVTKHEVLMLRRMMGAKTGAQVER